MGGGGGGCCWKWQDVYAAGGVAAVPSRLRRSKEYLVWALNEYHCRTPVPDLSGRKGLRRGNPKKGNAQEAQEPKTLHRRPAVLQSKSNRASLPFPMRQPRDDAPSGLRVQVQVQVQVQPTHQQTHCYLRKSLRTNGRNAPFPGNHESTTQFGSRFARRAADPSCHCAPLDVFRNEPTTPSSNHTPPNAGQGGLLQALALIGSRPRN
jgi:hypothetical protein